MVEKAGNSSPLVKFTYTENGKKVTKRIYLEPGLIFNFNGKAANEKGQYTVGDDGKVRNEKGDVVSEINLSKDQIGALMGIAIFDQSDNPDPRFEISDGDLYSAMNYENGYYRDAVIRDKLESIGASKDIVPMGQGFKPDEEGYDPNFEPEPVTRANIYGTLQTELTGEDGSRSSIEIRSPRLQQRGEEIVADGKRREQERFAREHPILNFFGFGP